MKKIYLTQGVHSVIDDCDFVKIESHKWHALKTKYGFVACTMIRNKPYRKRIYMHRFILNVIDPKIMVDHKDHNTLNNCRANLRLATAAQNRHNSRACRQPKTSKFLGVSYDIRDKKYIVQIVIDGKQKKIGRFKNESDAAEAYNNAAIECYGEFACLNKI